MKKYIYLIIKLYKKYKVCNMLNDIYNMKLKL